VKNVNRRFLALFHGFGKIFIRQVFSLSALIKNIFYFNNLIRRERGRKPPVAPGVARVEWPHVSNWH